MNIVYLRYISIVFECKYIFFDELLLCRWVSKEGIGINRILVGLNNYNSFFGQICAIEHCTCVFDIKNKFSLNKITFEVSSLNTANILVWFKKCFTKNQILKFYIILLTNTNICLFDWRMKILYIIPCVQLSLIESAVNWYMRVPGRLFYKMFALVNQIDKYFRQITNLLTKVVSI